MGFIINPTTNQHQVSFDIGTNSFRGICFIRDREAPDVAECPNCQEHKQREIERQERKRLRREMLASRAAISRTAPDILDAEYIGD